MMQPHISSSREQVWTDFLNLLTVLALIAFFVLIVLYLVFAGLTPSPDVPLASPVRDLVLNVCAQAISSLFIYFLLYAVVTFSNRLRAFLFPAAPQPTSSFDPELLVQISANLASLKDEVTDLKTASPKSTIEVKRIDEQVSQLAAQMTELRASLLPPPPIPAEAQPNSEHGSQLLRETLQRWIDAGAARAIRIGDLQSLHDQGTLREEDYIALANILSRYPDA